MAQLEALRAVLPLNRCLAWDRDTERAAAFALAASAGGVRDRSRDVDLAAAAGASDVIVTCTTAQRSPSWTRHASRRGTFVAAVGADSPDKSEIDPDLMARALVVTDCIDQCAAMGDLRHALEAGAMTPRGCPCASWRELVVGTKAGPHRADQITLFDSTGTALQDVAAAALHLRAGERTRPDLPCDRAGRGMSADAGHGVAASARRCGSGRGSRR